MAVKNILFYFIITNIKELLLFICNLLLFPLQLKSCLQESEKLVDYSSLWDGSLIFSVLLQIDPEPAHSICKLTGNNEMIVASRINNFHNIFKNLKTLYDEEFRQTIVSVPDFIELGTKPDSRSGLENMKLLILLLLGAAVQCPNRKTFIQNIYDLNITVQHAIKDYITQVYFKKILNIVIFNT